MAGLLKSLKFTRHERLADRWRDYRHEDAICQGVTYLVKYLGSTLVEELDDPAQSYGDGIAAEAVHAVVTMAKASNKKLPLVRLNISSKGITTTETETNRVTSDLDIYRISFCSADREHGKVFAYIARNKDNETMECHAFLCPKRKIAEAVTLAVAESFQIAKREQERLEEQQQLERQQQQLCGPSAAVPSRSAAPSAAVPSKPAADRPPADGGQSTAPPVLNNASVSNRQLPPSGELGFEDNFTDMKLNNAVYSSNTATHQRPNAPANVHAIHNDLINL